MNIFQVVSQSSQSSRANSGIFRSLRAFQWLVALLGMLQFSSAAVAAPFAYITHFQSNYVSVINVPTNTVVSTITVGQGPEALAIHPDGTRVYVGNFNSNSVSVISTATQSQSNVIYVGAGPRGLAVSPDGSRLYVANYSAGTVSIISTADMGVIATINAGPTPWAVAVTPDNSKVYVANELGNSVSVINAASNSLIRTIPVGYKPYGLTLSPDGNKLYVANFNSNSVTIVNTATDSAIASIPVGNGPFALALSPDASKLYVTTNANTVSVINTNASTVIASIPVGNHPQGISVTPDGSRVYVANYVGNSVSVINAASNSVMQTIYMANGPVAFGNFITPSSTVGTVVEFYNSLLDNYFITADLYEASAIDNGSAGPGWSRTGNSFKSGGTTAVCRFYGSQYPGPNSHFYTLAGSECDGLKQLQWNTPSTQKRWNFESLDFFSSQLVSWYGGNYCPYGTTPVFRAYNNGFARGVDSNHRITSNFAAIQQVVARGWINEGVVMCAPL